MYLGDLQEPQWQHRRTDMVLYPDLTEVFAPDDIPEGTAIMMHRQDGTILPIMVGNPDDDELSSVHRPGGLSAPIHYFTWVPLASRFPP